MSGLLGPAPNDLASGFTTFQEVSVNGVPVVKTIIHDRLEQIYARLSHTTKETPLPSYIVRLTLPSDLITFTGAVLNRSALIPHCGLLDKLLAECLLSRWRDAMPAALLCELQAVVNQDESSDPSPHANCSNQQKGAAHDGHPLQENHHGSAPSEAALHPMLNGRCLHTAPASLTSPVTTHELGTRAASQPEALTGPYRLMRPPALARAQSSRGAILRVKRVLERFSAPCMRQKCCSSPPSAPFSPIAGKVCVR